MVYINTYVYVFQPTVRLSVSMYQSACLSELDYKHLCVFINTKGMSIGLHEPSYLSVWAWLHKHFCVQVFWEVVRNFVENWARTFTFLVVKVYFKSLIKINKFLEFKLHIFYVFLVFYFCTKNRPRQPRKYSSVVHITLNYKFFRFVSTVNVV